VTSTTVATTVDAGEASCHCDCCKAWCNSWITPMVMRIECPNSPPSFRKPWARPNLALGNDHAYITPAHVLVAMLRQDDGPKALLQRAGVNVPGC
jgi:hypothetical protein